MLSILIPTYNYNITKLVNDLHNQAKSLGIDFEIVVAEDGSTFFLEENKKIESLQNVRYEILKKNIGRSAIRNYLADKAKYEYLIFIDCDAQVLQSNFLQKYLEKCTENIVISGGTAYDISNNNPEYSLRLKYGKKRECFDKASKKNKLLFTTFNFLIYKKLFQKIRFDETLVGYGCEDLIFGLQIKQQGFKLQIFDNQLLHIGLDANEIYLQKTENAMKNLLNAYKSGKYDNLNLESRVLNSFLKLKKLHLILVINLFFYLFKPLIIKQITGKNPSLFLFDLFKLGCLCELEQRIKTG